MLFPECHWVILYPQGFRFVVYSSETAGSHIPGKMVRILRFTFGTQDVELEILTQRSSSSYREGNHPRQGRGPGHGVGGLHSPVEKRVRWRALLETSSVMTEKYFFYYYFTFYLIVFFRA